MNQKEFGEYLRSLRKGKQLTLVELAEASDVSNPYISQIENGKFKPSNDVLHKLAVPLGVSHFDLMVAAGYYMDEELQRQLREDFYKSMTPEDEEAFAQKEMQLQKKYWNIQQYQEKKHVRLEDFLNNTRRNFYIDGHKLSNDDIKMLITLYGGKEKNYPSDEQIKKEYEEIKQTKEENEKRIASGEAFLIVNYDNDIKTNEDI